MPTKKKSDPKKNIKQQITELSKKVLFHQRLYYIDNTPQISDFEYDQLLKQLEELEEKYPQYQVAERISAQVGSDLAEESKKFKHQIPILSLKNSYDMQETLKWAEKMFEIPNTEILIQWKIDGATLVLYYQKGNLSHAVTRGSGNIGDEITENAQQISGISKKLKKKYNLVARGEVFMTFKDFAQVNESFNMIYLNPRNLAAGSLKHKNPQEVKKRKLRWLAFDCQSQELIKKKTDSDTLHQALSLGLPVPEFRICKTIDQLKSSIQDFEKDRNTLPFPCDGLVLKVNQLAARQTLGSTAHSPRWAIAYKFAPELAQTKIKAIEIQVGRTGRITPRAVLKEVQIAGTTVSHATLHNDDQIRRLDVRIGSKVEISKRGDIIPAVERVIKQSKSPPYVFPATCPSCESPLKKKDKLVGWFCTNHQCSGKTAARLIFFAGRNQMDIRSLGESTVRLFVKLGLLGEITDIYKLHKHQEQLKKIEGWGERSVQKLMYAIENSKKQSFAKFLVSLGLDEFGPAVVQLVIDAGYTTMKRIYELATSKDGAQRLAEIKGIGPKTCEAIIAQFHDKNLQTLIAELEDLGLPMEQQPKEREKKSTSEVRPLADQAWCITGSFIKFTARAQIAEILKGYGARIVATVSSKTTHLLVGNNPGSKLNKAKELSITILHEQDFLELLQKLAKIKSTNDL